jgi:4-carboxymuconolactone decarboxylase
MTPPTFTTGILLACAAAFSTTVHASTTEERTQRGAAAIADLNRGQPQPALEAMRREFPFLAEATEAYALGDVWSRTQQATATSAGKRNRSNPR